MNTTIIPISKSKNRSLLASIFVIIRKRKEGINVEQIPLNLNEFIESLRNFGFENSFYEEEMIEFFGDDFESKIFPYTSSADDIECVLYTYIKDGIVAIPFSIHREEYLPNEYIIVYSKIRMMNEDDIHHVNELYNMYEKSFKHLSFIQNKQKIRTLFNKKDG